MKNLRLKHVFRYDEIQGHFRLFRVMWERGEVGKPGGGHSNMVSVAVQLKLFEWDAEGEHWLLVVFGLRIHRKRSYGGVFT